jgi:hypothetical protein
MAKHTQKPLKEEPKWKMVERVVALLERTLDRGATVEHNVDLSDLGNPPHTRQCDIVVTTGPAHRRTRTIVEVQRRGKKVEIGHLGDWTEKMRAVGAQHLVCVSTVGYPSSVTDKAARFGPTVRLATLKELEKGSPVLQGVFGNVISVGCEVTGISHLELLVKDPARLPSEPGRLQSGQVPAFRASDGETFSLDQLVKRLLHEHPTALSMPAGKHVIPFESSESFDFLPDPRMSPIRLRIAAKVVITKGTSPAEVREYKQEGDALAWVMMGEIHGANSVISAAVTFRPGPDGRLAPQLMNLGGVTDGDVVSVKVGTWDTGTLVFRKAADE